MCPLRGQSLESRLAAQPGVSQTYETREPMTSTTEADKRAYCRCMEQVKRRLRLLSAITEGKASVGDLSADGEFACLQIRKILEQVAFASLAASRSHYAKRRPNIEKEWSAKRIIQTLEKVHPDFYPRPVSSTRTGPKRVHFEPLTSGFLTKDELVFLYDKCSEAIHDWNPFREGPRVVQLKRPIDEWAVRIVRLLSYHYIRLLGEEDLLLVELSDSSGVARVITASPTAG